MDLFPSLISLHLRYRLWIAEMNLDINILRIYNDYLLELKNGRHNQADLNQLNNFEKSLIDFRPGIDELKNEMHLLKMKLSTRLRAEKSFNHDTYQADAHPAVERKYMEYRNKFDAFKTELAAFLTRVLP
jgi:hypothetical protein